MSLKCTMILGDCLEVMPTLPKASVQMCFADLPYSTNLRKHSANTWDTPVDLAAMWNCLDAVSTPGSAKVLIGCMTLCSNLLVSNRKEFRYDLVVERYFSTGFLNSKRQPLRKHDLLLIFSSGAAPYFPQMLTGKPYRETARRPSSNYGAQSGAVTISKGTRFPVSIIRPTFEPERKTGIKRSAHPTQKSVHLLDWIIRTYSNPGDNVLDPVSGSGTTAVAALACGRNVVCIEKDAGYFDASVERVRKHVADNKIDATIEVRR